MIQLLPLLFVGGLILFFSALFSLGSAVAERNWKSAGLSILGMLPATVLIGGFVLFDEAFVQVLDVVVGATLIGGIAIYVLGLLVGTVNGVRDLARARRPKR